MWWLEQLKFLFLQFWMLEVQHQGPGDSVSCESYLPDMQMAAFLLCQHLAFLVCVCQEREGGGSGVSSFSYKDISHTGLGPHPYDFVLT